MKKVSFLIIGIIFSISCFGQNLIQLDKGTSVNLDNGAEKISKEQALSHVASKFNHNRMMSASVARRNPAALYKYGNILVSLFTDNHPVAENHLLNMKSGLDIQFKKDPSYLSSYKTINDNPVLIINYTVGDVEYYRFFSYNNTRSKALTGILEFDKNDKNKATALLDNLLYSVQYK